MDYDLMRQTNANNLRGLSAPGGGISFEQAERVVLIGAGHEDDAVDIVRAARDRLTGSIVKKSPALLHVSGCRTTKDQEDFEMEIKILEMPQYGAALYNVTFK